MGTHFWGIKRSKVVVVSHKENLAGVGRLYLHSCECWLLLVITVRTCGVYLLPLIEIADQTREAQQSNKTQQLY